MPATDKYGGAINIEVEATGFFRVQEVGGR